MAKVCSSINILYTTLTLYVLSLSRRKMFVSPPKNLFPYFILVFRFQKSHEKRFNLKRFHKFQFFINCNKKCIITRVKICPVSVFNRAPTFFGVLVLIIPELLRATSAEALGTRLGIRQQCDVN